MMASRNSVVIERFLFFLINLEGEVMEDNSQSRAEEKDMMVKVVVNLIKQRNE